MWVGAYCRFDLRVWPGVKHGNCETSRASKLQDPGAEEQRRGLSYGHNPDLVLKSTALAPKTATYCDN